MGHDAFGTFRHGRQELRTGFWQSGPHAGPIGHKGRPKRVVVKVLDRTPKCRRKRLEVHLFLMSVVPQPIQRSDGVRVGHGVLGFALIRGLKALQGRPCESTTPAAANVRRR